MCTLSLMFVGNSSETSASKKRKHSQEAWKARFKRPKIGETNTNTDKKTDSQNNSKKTAIEEKSFTCKECLEGFFTKKNPAKVGSTRICRNDSSSIQRHKSTWHKLTGKCTIVPTNSVDIANLKKKYERKKDDSGSDNEATESPNQASNQASTTATSVHESSIAKKPTQTTMLSFASNNLEKDSSTPKDEDLILKKLNELTLELRGMKTHHESICSIAFKDPKKSVLLEALRKCENLVDFLKVSKSFEWFCDEKTEEGILRCKACFHMYLKNNPRSSSLNPTQVRMVTKGNKFSTGMSYDKLKTRQLLQGGNDTWRHLKNLMINHLCLIGEGSNFHKEAESYFEKMKIQDEKDRSVIGNVFVQQFRPLN